MVNGVTARPLETKPLPDDPGVQPAVVRAGTKDPAAVVGPDPRIVLAQAAWRIETGVSMGRSGDRAGARAYLEETQRLASAAPGSNWFDYYSGQSYVDQFQGP